MIAEVLPVGGCRQAPVVCSNVVNFMVAVRLSILVDAVGRHFKFLSVVDLIESSQTLVWESRSTRSSLGLYSTGGMRPSPDTRLPPLMVGGHGCVTVPWRTPPSSRFLGPRQCQTVPSTALRR